MSTMQITLPEYAPSDPPDNVSILNITSTSVHLKWMPPTIENGPNYYYRITYQVQGLQGQQNKDDDNHRYIEANRSTRAQFGIINTLESYRNYSIYIEACVGNKIELCSPKSELIYAHTISSKPSKMDRPQLLEVKSYDKYKFKANMTWIPPERFNGEKSSYKLYSKQKDSHYELLKTIDSTYNHTEIDIDCGGDSKDTINMAIAASNSDHIGDLSEPTSLDYCQENPNQYLAIYGILSAIFIICSLILLVKGYSRHSKSKKKYRGITPALPAALIYSPILYDETAFNDDADESNSFNLNIELSNYNDIRIGQLNRQEDAQGTHSHADVDMNGCLTKLPEISGPESRNELCCAKREESTSNEDDIHVTTSRPKPNYVPFNQFSSF